MKLTRKAYCQKYPEMAKMRRNDPIQFDVAYNEWRLRNEIFQDRKKKFSI